MHGFIRYAKVIVQTNHLILRRVIWDGGTQKWSVKQKNKSEGEATHR